MSYSELSNYFIAEQPAWWHYILVVLFVAVVLAAILAWPFVLIFALNTLFVSLSIPYTFWTWLSVVILNMGLLGSIRRNLVKIADKL